MSPTDRTTKQIARDALKAAQADGLVRSFTVRDGGRATIYPLRTSGKYYTTSALDTLTVIEQIRSESARMTGTEACPDCTNGEIVLNPDWPSGTAPYSEKCSTCSGGTEGTR